MVGIAVIVGLLVVIRPWTDGSSCAALGSEVTGSNGFEWDNGFTGSGGQWSSVLTDGLTDVAADVDAVRRVHVLGQPGRGRTAPRSGAGGVDAGRARRRSAAARSAWNRAGTGSSSAAPR